MAIPFHETITPIKLTSCIFFSIGHFICEIKHLSHIINIFINSCRILTIELLHKQSFIYTKNTFSIICKVFVY